MYVQRKNQNLCLRNFWIKRKCVKNNPSELKHEFYYVDNKTLFDLFSLQVCLLLNFIHFHNKIGSGNCLFLIHLSQMNNFEFI